MCAITQGIAVAVAIQTQPLPQMVHLLFHPFVHYHPHLWCSSLCHSTKTPPCFRPEIPVSGETTTGEQVREAQVKLVDGGNTPYFINVQMKEK